MKFISYSLIFFVLSLWTLYWFLIDKTAENESGKIYEAAKAGKKLTFWVSPKGLKWTRVIRITSTVLWVSCYWIFSRNLKLEWWGLEFFGSTILYGLIFLIICKIFGLGINSEDIEHARKQIEEREKSRYKNL